jgi:uncharacterized Zn finger protein (UPF0148 family)
MISSTTITCPNCNTQFEPTDALRDQLQKDLRKQMQDWKAQQIKDFEQKETEFKQFKEQQEKDFFKKLEQQKLELASAIAKEQEIKFAEKFESQIKPILRMKQDSKRLVKKNLIF